MIKKSIWHHKNFWSFFVKKRHNLSFPRITYDIVFSTKKWCLGANQSGIEKLSSFSPDFLNSLRRLQATPPLQTSLVRSPPRPRVKINVKQIFRNNFTFTFIKMFLPTRFLGTTSLRLLTYRIFLF